MTGVDYGEDGRERLAHGAAEFPIAVYSGDLVREEVPLHWHDEFEAGIVTAGEICLQAGTQKYPLRAGEGYFVNAGVLHAFRAGTAPVGRQKSIVFHPALVGDSPGSVFWQRYCAPLTRSDFGAVVLSPYTDWQRDAADAIGRVWTLCTERTPDYELEVRYRLGLLLGSLNTRLHPARYAPEARVQRSTERLKLMVEFIRAHADEDLTIEQVAASASVSHSECLRCFRDTIGTTPLRYLRSCRMQHACELLTRSGESVAAVAAACGYPDVSYFTRVFREVRGCTPAEYRRRARAGHAAP